MVVKIGICSCCTAETFTSLYPQLVAVAMPCNLSNDTDSRAIKPPLVTDIASTATAGLSGVIGCLRVTALMYAISNEFTHVLPTIHCDELADPALKDNFLRRVFAYADYQQSMATGFSCRALVAFHSRYKFLVMAHGTVAYRQLGRLVGNGAKLTPAELQQRYLAELLNAMQRPESRGQHTNTLQHLQGFLKTKLTSEERQTLTALIEQYRCGTVSLDKPIQLLQHYLQQYPDAYLAQQAYFSLYASPIRIPS